MTDQATATPVLDREGRNDDLVLIGWITVFLLPLAAIIIGAVLRRRGDRRGTPILAVSIGTQIVVAIVGIAILTSGGASAPAAPTGPASASCVFDGKPTAAEMRACEKRLGEQLVP
jgi:hypothetical protein